MVDQHDAHRKTMTKNGFVEIFLHGTVQDTIRTLHELRRWPLVVLPFCTKDDPLHVQYRGYFGTEASKHLLREDIVRVQPDLVLPGRLENLVRFPDHNEYIALATQVDEHSALFDVYRLK